MLLQQAGRTARTLSPLLHMTLLFLFNLLVACLSLSLHCKNFSALDMFDLLVPCLAQSIGQCHLLRSASLFNKFVTRRVDTGKVARITPERYFLDFGLWSPRFSHSLVTTLVKTV